MAAVTVRARLAQLSSPKDATTCCIAAVSSKVVIKLKADAESNVRLITLQFKNCGLHTWYRLAQSKILAAPIQHDTIFEQVQLWRPKSTLPLLPCGKDDGDSNDSKLEVTLTSMSAATSSLNCTISIMSVAAVCIIRIFPALIDSGLFVRMHGGLHLMC